MTAFFVPMASYFHEIAIRNSIFDLQDIIPPITTVRPVLSGKYQCCKGMIRLVLPISVLGASFGSHIFFGHINRDQEDKEEQQNLSELLELRHCPS